ncbi:hypothetical protein HH310_36740 [Actinoplanes sp. TBRC 11911]|uniref:DUF6879 family protein n=1 Tax=Actinoplanes sp. TBRC 11911 TaxID=2729386 RepID=UPI00145F5B35|nr:DUF6879 family protein [Actinoplanes sp. TBRC 11911]NMO56709.1 hypothetical protein [Actinoplanes sp. TBRC 11911]
MRDLLDGAVGELMELDAYRADFEENFWTTTAPGFWKLERQQFFQEPGNKSWEAFAQGDWQESLRIIDADRPEMIEYYRKVEARGFVTRRVRVVEQPIIPYLQWELRVLRMRDQYGGSVRIVTGEQVAEFEREGPLPEIYTHGTTVMYQAVYGDDGVLESARRFIDRDLVVRCQRVIQDLYAIGQPLGPFFAEHVAALTPPLP